MLLDQYDATAPTGLDSITYSTTSNRISLSNLLSVSDNSGGVVNFDIKYGVTNDVDNPNHTPVTGATNQNNVAYINNLVQDTEYFVFIRAKDSNNNTTPWRMIQTTTTNLDAPTGIDQIAFSSSTNNSITLQGLDNVSDRDYPITLRFFYTLNKLGTYQEQSVTRQSNTNNDLVTITGLRGGRRYYFKIEAADALGNRTSQRLLETDNLVTVNTSAQLSSPITLARLASSPANTVVLEGFNRITDVDGLSGTWCKVRWRVKGTTAWTDGTAFTPSGSPSTHQVGGLTANTTYQFQVLATDEPGQATIFPSNTTSYEIKTDSPSTTTGSGITVRKSSVSPWDKLVVEGIDNVVDLDGLTGSYCVIQYKKSTESTYQSMTATNSSTQDITRDNGIVGSTTYNIRARITDSLGNVTTLPSASTVWSITTDAYPTDTYDFQYVRYSASEGFPLNLAGVISGLSWSRSDTIQASWVTVFGHNESSTQSAIQFLLDSNTTTFTRLNKTVAVGNTFLRVVVPRVSTSTFNWVINWTSPNRRAAIKILRNGVALVSETSQQWTSTTPAPYPITYSMPAITAAIAGQGLEVPGVIYTQSSAVNADYTAAKAFNGTFWPYHSAGLIGGVNISDAMPQWIQAQYPTPYKVNRYKIWATPEANYKDAPIDWTLQGSLDGDKWVIIDTRANSEVPDVPSPPSVPGQHAFDTLVTDNYSHGDYTVANPASYTHYRLNVTKTGGGVSGRQTFLKISEIQLFDADILNTSIASSGTEAEIVPVPPPASTGWYVGYGTDNTGVIATALTSVADTSPPETLMQNDATTKYVSDETWPQWIQYQLPEPKKLTRYLVRARDDNLRRPSGWKIFGSNDGIDFTLVHDVLLPSGTFIPEATPQTLVTDAPASDFYEGTVTSDDAYTYYRLEVNGQPTMPHNSVERLSINHWALSDEEPLPPTVL